ncbi:MAG: NUDIX pyrophosphatase [Pseudomonadota bacterium]|nr:MAG: NUDIX pyrophosphatase [Pseudomonadota bacterium]
MQALRFSKHSNSRHPMPVTPEEKMPSLRRREVVTAFLRARGKVLIVRRSRKVGTYQGRWSGISGYLEDPTPHAQVLREIREETGLGEDSVHLVAECETLEIPAPEHSTCWVVHPFLFDIDDPDAVRLDWENTELAWITPGELAGLTTVPALDAALARCLEQERRTRE